MQQTAVKERTLSSLSFLREPETSFLPALAKSDLQTKGEKWHKAREKISSYPWVNEKFKRKALEPLTYAQEMDDLGLREQTVYHLGEVATYLVRDILQSRGIPTEEFFENLGRYNCYPMDNATVELDPKVFEITDRFRHTFPLEFLVAKPRARVDPVLLARVKGGNRWFKLLEW